MYIQKIKTLFRLSPDKDKPLSPEERRKRAKYIIYPAMGVLFIGSLWLIYSPSGKEKAEEEKGKGFNTEMPSPEKLKMEGNKVNAYAQEELAKKEKARRGAFQEAVSLFASGGKEHKDTVRLPDAGTEVPEEPAALSGTAPVNTVRSSANAYRNINRTLDNLYAPANDPEKEELLRKIKELEKKEVRKTEQQQEANSLEEKMALMEKSYELAARYNGKQAATALPVKDKKERTAAKPIKNVQQQVVSSLSQPMVVDDRFIPKGTVLTGGTRIQGERLDIVIDAVEFKGSILPVELEVYDADGQQGILVPNSMEYDAAREIAANMGTSMGSSINISTDAGAQIASDVGKGVIQGVSQYVSKRMRTVKITLKAGHKLLLHSPEE